MLSYRYGGKRGKKRKLKQSRDILAVRSARRVPLARLPLSAGASRLVQRLEPIAAFPAAGVEVLRGQPRRPVERPKCETPAMAATTATMIADRPTESAV